MRNLNEAALGERQRNDNRWTACGEKSGLVDSCVGEDALVKSQFITALYTSKCCVVKPWKWNMELAR